MALNYANYTMCLKKSIYTTCKDGVKIE